VRERPILFSAPMVRAILAGTKTQTRRIVKPQPELNPNYSPSRVDRYTTHPEFWWPSNAARSMVSISDMASLGPYGSKGDRLWVKETHVYRDKHDRVYYRADHEHADPYAHNGWRPSIFMPRWASRITLEVTGVRVERLHAITEEDARAEGVVAPNDAGHCWPDGQPRRVFADLWRQINGAESWDANPWVWVVSFKRLEAQERAA